MAVPLFDYAKLSVQEHRNLVATLSSLISLERVLAWARGLRPPRGIDEILTQDEYTHDVVLAFYEGRYLVFDTT
jgi:hypothetical protein